MKVLLAVCLSAVMLLTACSNEHAVSVPPSPEVSPESESVSTPEMDPDNNYFDLSGEPISVENGAIKAFELSYALVWNFDSDGCKKIAVGDSLCGFTVSSIESRYIFDRYSDKGLICDRNTVSLSSESPVKIEGMLVFEDEGVCFYAFPSDGENLPFVSPRDEANENDFRQRSTMSFSDGKSVSIQPIRIALKIDDRPAEREAVYKLLGINDSGEKFLPASADFTFIYFDSFSDGEGAGFWGTRGFGSISGIALSE